MKKTVKLTREQVNMLLEGGVLTYNAGNVTEDPGLLRVAQRNNGNISVATFNNGPKSQEPVNITSDVDNVADTAAEVRGQGINANIVVPANGTDSAELSKAETDAQNAGGDVQKEARFSKKEIMEMRIKYLNENSVSYAKKDFYNGRNSR